MKIKKALLEDLPEIMDLQKRCYVENAERYNDYNISPLTQTLEEVEKEHIHGTILKAVIESKIVGSIRAYEKEGSCFIGKIIVHPDYQNRGIGKALFNEVEQQFNHAKRYELYTGFRDEKNLYLYKKLSYTEFKQKELSDNFTFVFLEKYNTKES